MKEELQKYASSIKRKHSFRWTPKHEESFRTGLKKQEFISLAIQAFNDLEWNIVYGDQNTVEAKYLEKWGVWEQWTEKITVSYLHGKVHVKSVSEKDNFWDKGRNSKRVRLFIHAFKQLAKSIDEEDLNKLIDSHKAAYMWDDYSVPSTLPQPKTRKPQIWIPLAGSTLTALILAGILAWLMTELGYCLLAYEFGIAISISYAMWLFVKLGNYTESAILEKMLMGAVILVYILSLFFQYLILDLEHVSLFGFIEYLQLKLEIGVSIESLHLGWIGLLLLWLVQIGVTVILVAFLFSFRIMSYMLERVPPEVAEYASYFLIKEYSEEEVRAELAKLGWTNKQHQDEVFMAIGANNYAQEWNRM